MFSRRELIKNLSLGAGSVALAPFFQHMKLHTAGKPREKYGDYDKGLKDSLNQKGPRAEIMS